MTAIILGAITALVILLAADWHHTRKRGPVEVLRSLPLRANRRRM